MKGLKKIALVAAIAAAPIASHAGMKALDDTTMGNVTGQAGVTIELETRVDIGKFTYTDEGSFSVSGIALGGAGVATGDVDAQLLDQLKIDIDINAAGDAVIHVGSLNTQELPDGTVAPMPIDWGMTANSMELTAQDGSQSTTLLSRLSGHGNLSQLDIVVHNDGVGDLQLDVGFNVVDMEFDVDFLGVGVSGMSIMGADYTETLAAYVGSGMTEAQAKALLSTTNFATASLSVYKGDGLGDSAMTDVLRIDVSNVAMDLTIDDVIVGGTIDDVATRSIGSIALDNLVISDTKLAVYGH